MCAGCSVNGAELTCPTCRASYTTVFPFDGSATLGELLSYSWDRFKVEAAMVIVSLVLAVAILLGGGMISGLANVLLGFVVNRLVPLDALGAVDAFLVQNGLNQALGLAIGLPVQGVALVGLYRVVIDVAMGRRADLARMFSQLHLVVPYVAVQGVVLLVTTVPIYVAGFASAHFLLDGDLLADLSTNPVRLVSAMAPALLGVGLLSVVLSLIALPLSYFAVPELVVSEAPPMEVLRRAWVLGSGRRLQLIGYGLLCGVLLMASILACCVPVLASAPFVLLLTSSLFLALRKGSALPPAARL